jgi:hypothetical protein
MEKLVEGFGGDLEKLRSVGVVLLYTFHLPHDVGMIRHVLI